MCEPADPEVRRRRPGWFGWRRSPRVRVEVNVDDGDLRLDGVLTVLRAYSEDGDLELRAHAGSSMEDNWAIRADDGDISLVLPDDFAADLRLSSDDGPIEVEPPVAVPGRVSRHRLSGHPNGGGPDLRVRSDDGTSPSGDSDSTRLRRDNVAQAHLRSYGRPSAVLLLTI